MRPKVMFDSESRMRTSTLAQFAMLRRVALSDPVVLPSYPKAANHSVSTPSASMILYEEICRLGHGLQV